MDAASLPYQRILITGAAGQLGGALTHRFGSTAIGVPRSQLDITAPGDVDRAIAQIRPELVINTAAYTAVDNAETDEDACFAVNDRAIAHLSQACAKANCTLVQVSTDYVFGGDSARSTPYREADDPDPVNNYGRSKLAGERAALKWPNNIVIRTCGLYASGTLKRGRNFADTMLSLAADREEVRVVSDQCCTPTYVPHFVDMLIAIVASGKSGLFHATSGGFTNWYAFAAELLRQADLATKVVPISSDEYPTAATRPRYSCLDTMKLADIFSGALPHWKEGIAAYLAGLSR